MIPENSPKIVKVIDGFKFVINQGSKDGVLKGDVFSIIEIGEIIIDPETNKELEKLEIFKGQASPVHIQDNITTIRSIEISKRPDKREIKRTSGGTLFNFLGENPVTEITTPGETFDREIEDVKLGDFAVKKLKK